MTPQQAQKLAAWTMQHMVNRTDVWGAYYRDGDKVNVYTAPRKSLRGEVVLTEEVIADHFLGNRTIGLHSTSADDTCRWVAIDIDAHGGECATTNDRAADAWREKMHRQGVNPLIEKNMNAPGSVHVWCLFDAPLPCVDAWAWIDGIVSDWESIGLASRPETFPKQPTVGGGFGNWLRLPGVHPKRGGESILIDGDLIFQTTTMDRLWVSNPTAFFPKAPASTMERLIVRSKVICGDKHQAFNLADSSIIAGRIAAADLAVSKAGKIGFSCSIVKTHDIDPYTADATDNPGEVFDGTWWTIDENGCDMPAGKVIAEAFGTTVQGLLHAEQFNGRRMKATIAEDEIRWLHDALWQPVGPEERLERYIATVGKSGVGSRNMDLFRILAVAIREIGCTPEQAIAAGNDWNNSLAAPLPPREVESVFNSVLNGATT